MMETREVRPVTRRLPQRASKRAVVCALAIVALSTLVCLTGCATLHGRRAAALPSPAGRIFDPSLLRQGMSMAEVHHLEGRPQRTFRMTSRSMSVTEWIYERSGGQTKVYFTNGVLESWSS